MKFADLVTLVYAETNMPELKQETASAIRRAISYWHNIAFFQQDLEWEEVQFSKASTDLEFREDSVESISGVQFIAGENCDGSIACAHKYYSGCKKPCGDVWTRKGDLIKVSSFNPSKTIFAGGKRKLEVGKTTWLCAKYEFAIVDKACEYLFGGPINDQQRRAAYAERCGNINSPNSHFLNIINAEVIASNDPENN